MFSKSSDQDHTLDRNPSDSKLMEMRESAQNGGGKDRIEAQHQKGKYTARERIDLLVDQGSFVEINNFITHQNPNVTKSSQKPLGDGVVTGYGLINERKVYLYSQDFTVMGGSLGYAHAQKICKVMDLAYSTGSPIIGLIDSGGARIQEGINALAGYGDIFHRNVKASGVIPQISVILGPCAGGAAYSPALTDFIIMGGQKAYLFVTGPSVVEAATSQKVSFDDLGGAKMHSSKSGIAALASNSEEEALDYVRKLLSYIPSNNMDSPPINTDFRISDDISSLDLIIPEEETEPYDMKDVISHIVDKDSFFEIFPSWAQNMVIGFAHLQQQSVGIIANQPKVLGGAIDYDASDKASRFIRFCNAFNIPIISFVDVPGFMPGLKQEAAGIIRHGAKLIYAYSEATVPKLTVITRKAYGGAYIVMSSKHLGADLIFAWNSSQIAVMGAKGACKIIYRKELKESEDPKLLLEEFAKEYKEKYTNPYVAASYGHINKIIFPHETRDELIQALFYLMNKREEIPKRKNGVFPV
ncbi:MAG: acyl-CoA carboxylase subunit beta [Candidatus Lokiarchaeota archaeon]